jgi:hypothetical protein
LSIAPSIRQPWPPRPAVDLPTLLRSATPGDTESDFQVDWSPNPEGDVSGYKVYWGNESGMGYANVQDVGAGTSFILDSLSGGDYYLAVTAYDSVYHPDTDDTDTIVNENQTSGNESWYSEEVAFTVPEPSMGLLQLAALGTLMALGRSRG